MQKKKTYIDKSGYKRFLDSGKLLHRWVYEKIKGRSIREGNHVHHKDGNKLNNFPRNLEDISPRSHYFKHHGKKRSLELNLVVILAILIFAILILFSLKG